MGKRGRKAKRGGRVTPKGTRPGAPARGAPPGGRSPRRREPDLMDDVADALGSGNPLELLALASGLVDALTARRSPFDPPGLELPPVGEVVRSFVEVPRPETTAMLAALATLLPDEVAARSARRELERRPHPLPAWLTGLDRTTAGRVVEVADVLGDASNVMIEVDLAGDGPMTFVAYLDKGAGSVVADGFVVAESLGTVLHHMEDASASGHMTVTDLDPADARVLVEDGVRFGAMMAPPFTTETWPASRPLLLWISGLLPEGGAREERPEWSDADAEALIEAFLASAEGEGFDDPDHRDLLDTLVWLGTGYGSGDPLRWSPSRVEHLLLDLVPRKVMAPPAHLAKVPSLLWALVGYGHRLRGIPADLTEETIGAIERLRPEYEEAIADRHRPQGAAALAARALGLAGATSPALRDIWTRELADLEERAGGPEALAALGLEPLPDEALDLAGVPDDVVDRVREVAGLCDEACTALLGVEARTACRRLLGRLAREGPEVFRRRGRSETAAAALCWAVGRDGGLVGPAEGQVTAKDLLAHFGLTGSISARAGTLLRAAGLDARPGRERVLPPEMVVAAARRQMVADAARYRSLLDASAEDRADGDRADGGPDEDAPDRPPTLFALPDAEPPHRAAAPATGPTHHRLKVTLDGIRPPIWRRLEVDSTTTLAELHDVLQVAFGWFDDHLHSFTVGDRTFVPAPMVDEWNPFGDPAADEDTVTVAEVLAPGTTATYTYDFGDDWEHRIVVESVVSTTGGGALPRCTGGRRAGPPEDVGGAWGYQDLLVALADPDHPDHDDKLDWMGGPFDPERFSADEVTRRLRQR